MIHCFFFNSRSLRQHLFQPNHSRIEHQFHSSTLFEPPGILPARARINKLSQRSAGFKSGRFFQDIQRLTIQ